jgi:hypothetical protein
MTSTKLNLLFNNDDSNAFSHPHMRELLLKHFNILIHQPDTEYNKADTILVVNAYKLENPLASYWYKPYYEQGFKIVVDNLWEHKEFYVKLFPEPLDNCFLAYNPNWFWYSESIWYEYLGYKSYTPNKNIQKLALMPMRINRQHRMEMVVRFAEILDELIWSYSSFGRSLPGDLPTSHIDYQRYFNPNWYDSTYFSIVAESQFMPGDIFVTEKTFKPMAFYHPMIIMAQPGHLKYIKSQGFETFENLFDESYDNIEDWVTRIELILTNVKNFQKEPYSDLTKEKLAHNHNLFYNSTLVESKIVNELINPIIEYAET